jgi:hypothetical protein
MMEVGSCGIESGCSGERYLRSDDAPFSGTLSWSPRITPQCGLAATRLKTCSFDVSTSQSMNDKMQTFHCLDSSIWHAKPLTAAFFCVYLSLDFKLIFHRLYFFIPHFIGWNKTLLPVQKHKPQFSSISKCLSTAFSLP